MPCYRCAARQVDPARGASAWKRGVRGGQQVLVCPACQVGRDWAAELDSCARCGSSILIRRLGETVCRSCGAATAPVGASEAAGAAAGAATGAPTTPGAAAGAAVERAQLAAEVDAALRRLFDRPGQPPDPPGKPGPARGT